MELLSFSEISKNTPSRKDGIIYEQECTMRKGACLYIKHAGALLKLYPSLPSSHCASLKTNNAGVVSTPSILTKPSTNTPLRRSLTRHDRFVIATTSLYLAAKIAETPRKIRDIVNVAYQILNSRSLSISPEYWDLKDVVVKMESIILRTLAFDLAVEHPHRYLLNYIYSMNITNAQLPQNAWSILSDSYCTTLCLQYPPHVIAAGCIYLAAKLLNFHIPDGEVKKWWMVFDVSMVQIEDVCNQILALYESSMDEEDYTGTEEWLKLVEKPTTESTPKSTPKKD